MLSTRSLARSVVTLVVLLTLPMTVATQPATAASAPAQERTSAAATRTVSLRPALQRVLHRVNKVRLAHGRKPLRVTRCLTTKVAQPWARHMATTGRFEHQDLGAVFTTCPTLSLVGENIAYGQPTAKAVMRAWMASPGHRRNILDRRYRKIGLGLARGADGRRYWVQDFGR